MALGYHRGMSMSSKPVGELLREWRRRRRISQLELACEANISPRHVSFLETGRSQPSRDMLLRLAERLAVPLRERNRLLHAAGFAPLFPQRALDAPDMQAVRAAIELILAGHEPYPALAVDRHWTLVAANRAALRLLTGIDPALLAPPVNVLRLSLHPAGLATRIANLAQWRAHLLERLHRQIEACGDPVLERLHAELAAYPAVNDLPAEGMAQAGPWSELLVPLGLVTEDGTLSFFSTTTVFGTPIDVTLSELALETFFPADSATADWLHAHDARR